MKVNEILSTKIKETYNKHRKSGLRKEAAYRMTAREVGVGRTTVVDHVNYEEPKLDLPKVEKTKFRYSGEPKVFIISGWEIRVDPDEKFLATLEVMKDYYDAELLLVPCQKSDVPYLPKRVKDLFTVVTENIQFNQNLDLKFVETNALIQSPLAGHVGAYDRTTIIPGLTKELRTLPSQYYVKQLISTGSLGTLEASLIDYDGFDEDKEFIKKMRGISTRRHGKATAIAQNYIESSALIVEVLDNKVFLTRFITSSKGGVVYDLNKRFSPSGYEDSQPAALYCGDVHAYTAHRPAINATFEMIDEFKPKEVIVGDFFDGSSINHHEMNDQVKMHHAPSLREEADITISLLKEFCDRSNKVIYLHSNHEDFLSTWLKYGDRTWRLNRNYEIGCGLQFFHAQTQKNPIIKLLEFNKFPNLKYVRDADNHFVGDVIAKHGHEGMSGARVGFWTLAKVYNRYIQGHTHSPAVFRNAVCVGLLCELDQGYNKGASAWLHANAVIQPDNNIQLLPIIYGRWRA